jgi:hypothetical protein
MAKVPQYPCGAPYPHEPNACGSCVESVAEYVRELIAREQQRRKEGA